MHVCYLVQQNIALKRFFAQSLSQGSTADGKSHIKVAGFQSGAEGCHLWYKESQVSMDNSIVTLTWYYQWETFTVKILVHWNNIK